MLAKKTIVLGVTGGIAAYKVADLASKLTQAGARVLTVMTESAQEFVTPLTFRALTGQPVITRMFDLNSEFSIQHVQLAEMADVIIIAPATANTIAKLAAGIADDMLTCTVLATKAPVVLAPAMDVNMYANTATQKNITELKQRGFIIIEPSYGRMASGKVGQGRLPETEYIKGIVAQVLGQKGDLAGKRIVVTAGGTQELIDPVRYIGNPSSGKMGYALAEAARDRGAGVVLITAPTALADPAGIAMVHVRTAAEMKDAVVEATAKANVLVMSAAVADFQVKEMAKEKIKKEGLTSLTLELVRTPDILTEVRGDFIRVGFAAESTDVIQNAQKKLTRKELDLIAANDVTAEGSGFGVDTNKVTLIARDGTMENLPLLTKREVADKILDRVMKLMTGQNVG